MQAIHLGTTRALGKGMPERYVKSVGAYLPLLRLERKVAGAALAWTGLGGPRSGRRAAANWDEDALTMAVEAARAALADAEGGSPRTVIFASTSSPFRERSQATIVVEALNLGVGTAALDVAGSRRCGVGALRRALMEEAGDTLVAAGERRRTAPGSSSQLAWGDGGAAVLVAGNGVARLIGEASISFDFIDFYASESHPLPYHFEERFIRDEAIARILEPAVAAACKSAGISAADISTAVVQEPVSGTFKTLAASLGLTAPNLAERITHDAGDLGAAHALFGLGLALEQAKPGDKILIAGFGSGCDAIILEVSGPTARDATMVAALSHGTSLANYLRFLNLAGSLDLDWGPRSELDQKTSASVLARHGRDMHGFIGGRDAHGNVQFPKTAIPVSPQASGPEALADVRLADVPARILSITADRLNFTPDPPFHFGLAQFENGARVAMEFCDIEGAAPKVGDTLRMRFRIKSIDRKRGFRTYFWKAAPSARPLLEGN
jgi:hydroxymethylglutaryl-CoA synthase